MSVDGSAFTPKSAVSRLVFTARVSNPQGERRSKFLATVLAHSDTLSGEIKQATGANRLTAAIQRDILPDTAAAGEITFVSRRLRQARS